MVPVDPVLQVLYERTVGSSEDDLNHYRVEVTSLFVAVQAATRDEHPNVGAAHDAALDLAAAITEAAGRDASYRHDVSAVTSFDALRKTRAPMTWRGAVHLRFPQEP
jgi:hypothetical protein